MAEGLCLEELVLYPLIYRLHLSCNDIYIVMNVPEYNCVNAVVLILSTSSSSRAETLVELSDLDYLLGDASGHIVLLTALT